MRRPTALLIVGALFLLCQSPRVALAQDVKSLLRKANRLFTSGDYPAALEVFKQGYAIRPTPVFLRNMAYSLLKMYKHREAGKRLQEYLVKYPGAADKKKIQDILKGLSVVVRTRLQVISDPPGAVLYIDTEAGGKVGITPYSGTVSPGKHTIILKRPGYYATTRAFTIQANQSVKLQVSLQVPLEITSTPPGADIKLDSPGGQSLGRTPFSGGITPGKVTLFLVRQHYRTRRKSIQVKPGKPMKISLELLLGLKVSSDPAGAVVLLDGKPQPGKTPLEIGARQGEHTVRITMKGFRSAESKVLMTPSGGQDLHLKLVGGLLAMRADIPGARVTVGQLKVGQAPLDRTLVPEGKQLVKVEHPDRRTWSRALDFSSDQLVDTEVKLGRPLWPVWVSGGLGLAGIVAGSVTAALAKNRTDEGYEQRKCNQNGDPTGLGTADDCGYSLHNASTASFITAGVAAGVALAYYLIWGRSSATIKRTRVQTASR